MGTRTLPVVLLLLAAPLVAVRADLPRPWWQPRPDPSKNHVQVEAERLKRQAPLVVTVEEQGDKARLLIPRKLLKAWQHASLTTPRDTAVAAVRGWSPATLAAGLGLTLAVTAAGLSLAGCRRRRDAALLLLPAIVALGALGALARADVPPGPSPRRVPWADVPREVVPAPLRLQGKVEVEVVPQGEVMQLFVPRSLLTPLRTQKPPEPPRSPSP